MADMSERARELLAAEYEANGWDNAAERIREGKAPQTHSLQCTLRAIDAAIAQEREACAKIIEEIALEASANDGELWILEAVLKAIRARGDHIEGRGDAV